MAGTGIVTRAAVARCLVAIALACGIGAGLVACGADPAPSSDGGAPAGACDPETGRSSECAEPAAPEPRGEPAPEPSVQPAPAEPNGFASEDPIVEECPGAADGAVELVCEWKQHFSLGGGLAVVTDLSTTTGDGGAGVETALEFESAPTAPVSARVVVDDPYGAFGGALDFEAAPTAGADCLAETGGAGARSCEVAWDLTDTGFGIAGLQGLLPNTRIIFSDGGREVTVWVIRVEIS